jgi:acyl-CoA reductase-like NAD-dependent aldehyde dehydrogenase
MARLEVLKTYKIYIGGQFPRTESGRYYSLENSKGLVLGNVCLSSKKDVRNAIVAARKAFGGWSERAAFNRSQILYRMAEMLEGRKSQFITELIAQGSTQSKAEAEIDLAIDRTVYYAGWCDKYQQILSAVNPVSSSHFNFSVAEPTGVVGIIAPEDTSLIGLVSLMLPVIAGGNTCVVLASHSKPLCGVTLGEVIHSSDVPPGVVNILTGKQEEMIPTLTTHMDVNAITSASNDAAIVKSIQENAVHNVKRSTNYSDDWRKSDSQGLHFIAHVQEIKTTWHPIENIGGATSAY